MADQGLTYDSAADAVYVHLLDKPVARTRSLDDLRIVDYAEDGSVVGVEFVGVSAGIDLSDVPSRDTVERLILAHEHPFKVMA